MKKSLTSMIFLFLIFSCVDYQEEFSARYLEGEWVNELVNDYETLENILVFQMNGTYESFFIRKENSEGFAPGIVGYYQGKYSVMEDKLTFSERRYFYPEDFENPPASPDELLEQNSFPMVNQNASLAFENNNKVMVLVFECVDFHTGTLSMCLEPEPAYYDKVEE
ncbi:hypothetical protein A33Q_4049 [Indibacter alkaliphilus LW1]|uniref:Lipocalin-like domain-containing protein n=1 Tax=Indibacter alkaliphilus (strain CCUG 57479 / KCTC 22604 / LW1) TaxID=1189612 RepID=S2DJ23_INDAL|nr:hypothetical protein [Indibacter alkaliphilus]EOZ91956.1 hypothetical protein A33Q_4049 [Indibacter alkaliphilus LW1]